MSMSPLFISATSLVNALGNSKLDTLKALQSGVTGLRPCSFPGVEFDTFIGEVAGIDEISLGREYKKFECRNNRLVKAGLEADNFKDSVEVAKAKYGADRIGMFLGTSTSGIAETEKAYQLREAGSGKLPSEFDFMKTDNFYSLVYLTKELLGLHGPGLCISTACSSSAKVFVAASRYIDAGWCDAAIVGGVDSLCLSALYGFNSLELVSRQPCRPWDVNRDGINIGEAAGFALIEKDKNQSGISLVGYGESSDAYHMSTPHPTGEGAVLAMQQALQTASLEAPQINYVNLHGTATPSNDKAEDKAILKVFGEEIACSSTKGWTGHTLGAAGITEAIITCMVLEYGFLPQTLNLVEKDPDLRINVITSPVQQSVAYAMSNSFGFGGSNCSLIFGYGK